MPKTSYSGFPPEEDDSSSEILEGTLKSKSTPINEYIAENPIHDMSSAVYVGFWVRFVAYLADAIVLLIPTAIVYAVLGEGFGDFVNLIIALFYYTIYESSEAQATLGKQAMGVIVIDKNGQRLTSSHAAGRFFSKLLNIFTLGIGYLIIGFTTKKTGLHDTVAGTYVVRK